MSATNRGSVRAPLDYYRTPTTAIVPVLEELDIQPGVTILDAGCGDGAILQTLIVLGHEKDDLLGVELDPERANLARQLGVTVATEDYLQYDPGYEADWCIMNPPFTLAVEFIHHTAHIGARNALVLLRLGFLEGKQRYDFHRQYKSDVYVLSKRPSFTGGGTDASAYAWFHFHPGATGQLRILPP